MKRLMEHSRKKRLVITMSVAVFAGAGCVAAPAHRGSVYAPPPYAPAPGYHQMYRGHDIRYDANLGVYIVMDLPNHYYFDDNFYRYHSGRWYYSHDLEKHWRHYDGHKLPPGLAKKYRHEDNGRHRDRDHHWDHH